ncbi:hypothetical protein [Stigmatella aurantiaca]|uniref:Uncharacterized protein n=1 Tax=Stigmatella aurantiaca (strain DW4/3-1) TaxID=378806 RepID=E3FQ69_STIAD|nr:hypothetical protein [Stigmatella aurantiaca]ADO68179.1 uncharacterized protein STAUR_0370 [Stigmatella aurantiaca DW4/3-1]
MSISALNRSSFSPPLSSTSHLSPAASEAQSVESIPAQQPQNGLWQQLMTDSFEQGPGALGGVSGGGGAAGASGEILKTVEQLSQALGDITQMLEAMEAQMQGGPGGAPGAQAAPAVAGGQASNGAPAPQTSAPVSGTSNSQGDSTHFTSNSDAGPGFGPPSAGSTDPVNPSEPWLAKNNVGSPYNSNMQLIDPGQKNQFKYTNTFTNKTNEPQTITLWNKTGENGGPNDGQNFDKSTPKTFTLQPGESQVVAFDNNSSVAWCASKDGTAKPGANSGQTWGEATFGNSATGWSGYDTSQISPAGHNGNMSITNDATGVTVTEANAWQTPSDNPAGHDIGVPAGPLNLTTTFS